jgi:hypothetical protein
VTTSEQYRARIKVLGLTPIGRASAGKYQFHRARGGRVYPIRDPDDLTEAERKEMIEYYEQQFSLE